MTVPDDERDWLIHTYDPSLSFVHTPYGDLLLEPADRSVEDAIARFERAGGVIALNGMIFPPETTNDGE